MLKRLPTLFSFFILFFFFFNSVCQCYEPVQTVIITKEDIQNAAPTKPDVHLSPKELHIVEIMEKRHFFRTFPEFSDSERLKNLEYELLGKPWEYTDTLSRLNTLKLASSNAVLIGTSLPPSISSKRNVKRMRNDSIPSRQRDSVGLLDGFLRLVSPEKYEIYRKYSDRNFEYEY